MSVTPTEVLVLLQNVNTRLVLMAEQMQRIDRRLDDAVARIQRLENRGGLGDVHPPSNSPFGTMMS